VCNARAFFGNGMPATFILPQDRKARAAGRVSLTHLASVLAKRRIRILASREVFKILWNFYHLQLLARQAPRHRHPEVREAFFDILDPELRDSVVGIYTRHFSGRRGLAEYECSRALTLRATSFLDWGYAKACSATTRGMAVDPFWQT